MGRVGRVMGFVSDEGRRAYLDAYTETLELASTPLVMTEVTTPFGVTHVTSAGPDDAPPAVVLHGKHCSSTMWLDLLPSLVRTHRVHLVDSSGELGKSVATKMMVRATDVARWLDAVIDDLGVRRAAFVGFSNGGFHAGTYASERPDRVERLAMLAPVGVFSRIPLSYWRRVLGTMVGDRDEKWERFWLDHYVSTEPSPLRQRFDRQFLVGNKHMRIALRDRMPRRFGEKRLAPLTMPVLVVFADQDLFQDASVAAARVAQRLPAARVELVSGAGHFVTFDRPAEIDALLSEFLATTAP